MEKVTEVKGTIPAENDGNNPSLLRGREQAGAEGGEGMSQCTGHMAHGGPVETELAL